MLAASNNTVITLEADGDDEKKAISKILKIFLIIILVKVSNVYF